MNVKGRSAKPHLAIENIISQVRKIAPMKEDNNIPPHVPMQENHMLKRQNNGNGVKATRRLDQSKYIYIYIYTRAQTYLSQMTFHPSSMDK